MPQLTDFPIWLQILAAVIAGLTIGIGILITRFGMLRGVKKTVEKEMMTTIVDARLTTEVARLATSIERLCSMLESNGGA